MAVLQGHEPYPLAEVARLRADLRRRRALREDAGNIHAVPLKAYSEQLPLPLGGTD